MLILWQIKKDLSNALWGIEVVNDNIAYIGGTYDPPHAGHVRLIERVVRMGYSPLVVINSDDFIAKYKNRTAHLPENDRKNYFDELGFDTAIVDKESQRELIERVNPDVIVVGLDWMTPKILPQLGIDEEFLEEHDIAMLFLTRTPGIDSTSLRANHE